MMCNQQSKYSYKWSDIAQGKQDSVVIPTPVGKLALYTKGNVLIKSEWLVGEQSVQQPASLFLKNLRGQILQYWEHRTVFESLTLLRQNSNFRQRVWAALCNIPYGETVTYALLAARLDTSPRAVGGACRHNPLPLIIPCHRVVSVSGIGGYAGKTDGELIALKWQLLAHEANTICKIRN